MLPSRNRARKKNHKKLANEGGLSNNVCGISHPNPSRHMQPRKEDLPTTGDLINLALFARLRKLAMGVD